MLDVLVYGPDTQQAETYTATLWPVQNYTVDGYETREAAEQDFTDKYNERFGTSKNPDDFRFIGPIWCTAYYQELGDGSFRIYAIGDRMYEALGSTMDEAKTNFIDMWNVENTVQSPICTDKNMDWQPDQGYEAMAMPNE